MRIWNGWAIRGILLVAVAVIQSWGQVSNSAQIESGQRKFARDYVYAVKSKNIAALKSIVHPKVLACVNEQNRDYFDFIFAKQLGRKLTGDYKLTVSPLKGDNPEMAFLPAEKFYYSIRPTYQVQIDFNANTYDNLTIIREVAPAGGRWYWVFACPNAQGMEFFRAQRQAGEKQQAKAQQLASELKDPLLSEIKQLLKEHKRIDAVKKYQAQTGADLTTTVQVINILQGREK